MTRRPALAELPSIEAHDERPALVRHAPPAGAVRRLAAWCARRSPRCFTVLVIGVALALPTALGPARPQRAQRHRRFRECGGRHRLFQAGHDAREGAAAGAQRARARRRRAVTADQPRTRRWKPSASSSGFGAALEVLEDNPLPHALDVRPDAERDSPAQLESLRRYFAAWPEVELVQVDSEWVQRSTPSWTCCAALVSVTAVLLGLGVLAVIGNTIRLEIHNRRAEIEVTKLVGGSNAFVRRPFLYTGLFYGLGRRAARRRWSSLGGITCSAAAVRGWRPVRQRLPAAWLWAARIGRPAGHRGLPGLAGRLMAAARHLARIEPRA